MGEDNECPMPGGRKLGELYIKLFAEPPGGSGRDTGK